MGEKIKVLIVDDSAVMRKMLTDALSVSKQIEVVGTALDPIIAADKIKRLNPDVITLDIEMPRMDGLTFLSKLMQWRPMPVLMVSAVTVEGAEKTMKALKAGAFDFIPKPTAEDMNRWDDFAAGLVDKVIAAARSVKKKPILFESMRVEQKYNADVILPRRNEYRPGVQSESLIAIGASTGGTEVIADILSSLPEDVPGILVVQHMPEKFTEAFANRVNGLSKIFVKEGADGDRVMRGSALIAPGNRHMLLKRDAKGYYVEINDGLPVNRHRPSVDVMFRSVAGLCGPTATGILLTGMGADGADGLLEMKESGSYTIAQDEDSSVVFGMPREAIKRGAAEAVMNPVSIVQFIVKQGK